MDRNAMSSKLKFGLLLPHFGEHASVEKCFAGARRAEAYGFDSVWARDHLVLNHILGKAAIAISKVSCCCRQWRRSQQRYLGTAMTICHRHPVHLAKAFAGLSGISNGRVIMGLGLGGFPHEFAAAGRPAAFKIAPIWHA